MASVKISVQAQPRDRDSWLALARRLDAADVEALLAGDHPGSGASPWPALGAAAAVTQQLKLGTYVLQAGVRDPMHAAADAATLDLLAPGRVLLGLGAGHTFAEWEVSGVGRPSPADRAGRLVEFVDAVAGLLAGETVTVDGDHLQVVEGRLAELPADGRVRLVVGGGHREILRLAAARASVVGLSGLGRTLPDGHMHRARWSAAELQSQLDVVAAEADRAGTSPEVEALVQVVAPTEDRGQALDDLAERLSGPAVADLDSTPFVLVGTVGQMADQLRRQSEELGITRYVVREDAVDTIEEVLAALE